MNVMCEVFFSDGGADPIKDAFKDAFRLWIEVWMPTAMPIGSTLLLPAPRTRGGPIEAKLTHYTVADDLLVCKAWTKTHHLLAHREHFLAIGYKQSNPDFERAVRRLTTFAGESQT